MTVITKLKLNGFKSFPRSTEIPFEKDFSIIIGPNGSGKCLVKDSLVQLADGNLIKIGDLVESKLKTNPTKRLDDGTIAYGDNTKVSYLDVKNLKIGSKKILSYVKRKSPSKLVKIITRSGRAITSTTYHPLFILKDGKITAINAENLKIGIRIAVPRQINIQTKTNVFFELLNLIKPEDKIYVPYDNKIVNILRKNKKSTWKNLAKNLGVDYMVLKSFLDKQSINFSCLVKILRNLKLKDIEIINLIPFIKSKTGKSYKMLWHNSPDFARFLGYLLAEGQLPSSNNQIRLTNGCDEIVSDYINIAYKLFKVKPTINEYKANCYDVLFYSQPIGIILNKFGMPFTGTKDKDVTNLFLSHSTSTELAELLNGLYSGDGYVGNNCIEIVTKSHKLGYAIETILTRLGITFNSKWRIKIATNSGFSGVYKIITTYGVDNFTKFNNQVKFAHPDKKRKLESILGVKSNPNLDLIEANHLVKQVAKELKLKIKNIRKDYPKLDAYAYNICLPSRNGLNQLINHLFLKQNIKSDSLNQLITLAKSDILWDEIVEIEELQSKEEYVYDLCVEGDHNFIANNIIVHNSNIIDAFCFVLGKSSSKSLRAEKSSNLIYNGGKKGKASKEAEVSIYFSNDKKEFPLEDKNIKVTRIVKPSGNSVYKINDKVRTRQQVIDLLNAARIDPDGHNIVLQGDIVKFTEMRSEDRRKLVEEIAGISVYEDKKEKALSELEKVSGKLNEAEIILTEREANLRELKKERDQAKRYNEVREQIKNNKATIFDLKLKEKNDKKLGQEKELGEILKKADEHNSEISKLRELITENRSRINEINKQVEEKGEKEQVYLRKKIEELKEDIIKVNSRIDVLKNELRKISERKIQLKNNIDDINKQIQEIKLKKKEYYDKIKVFANDEKSKISEIESFKRKHGLFDMSDYQNKVNNIEKEIENLAQEKEKLQFHEQDISKEKFKFEIKIQDIDEKLKEISSLEKEDRENIKKLSDLRVEFKKLADELGKRTNEDSVMSSQLNSTRRNLVEKNEQLAILRSKNLGIKEHYSQDFAVKKILEVKDKGVYGTLASLGSISTKYSIAMEVAAGPRMKSVIVDSDITAEKFIKKLKEERLGVVTFLPLNKIKSRKQENISKVKGIYGFADELIKFDAKFDNVFSYVFGSTLVVEDIDTARKIGIGKVRMVTIDGTLLEVSGAIVGGYRRPSGLGFSQKEVDEEIKGIEAEIEKLTKLVNLLDDKKIKNEAEIIKLRESKYNLESEIVKLESLTQNKLDPFTLKAERAELKNKLESINTEIKILEKNTNVIEDKILKNKEKKKMLIDEISNKPEIGTDLSKLEKDLDVIRQNILSNKSELSSFDNQIEKIFLPEMDRTSKILNDLDKEKEQFQKELIDISNVLKNKKTDLEANEKEEKKFYGVFKNLVGERNKLNEVIQQREKSIFQEETRVKALQNKVNEVNIGLAKIKAEMEALQRESEEFVDGKIRRGIGIDELTLQIRELEKEVSKLGNVNLRALEVYDQLEVEHKDLVEKATKLKLEKDDVLNLINEIEGKKKDLFIGTLRRLEKNFKEIFSSLSTKGEAFLELENQENPFNGGVNITVKIAGNKYMDIKSLSGGEKTLTALAFIFAIQEHEPASFYLFDEVDAALDKHNSEKLADLIAKYAAKAQYIVISHNDSIITGAQQIYGVSMQEGISKIVSLKI